MTNNHVVTSSAGWTKEQSRTHMWRYMGVDEWPKMPSWKNVCVRVCMKMAKYFRILWAHFRAFLLPFLFFVLTVASFGLRFTHNPQFFHWSILCVEIRHHLSSNPYNLQAVYCDYTSTKLYTGCLFNQTDWLGVKTRRFSCYVKSFAY